MDRRFAALLTIGCFLHGGLPTAVADSNIPEPIVLKAGVAKAVITPVNWKELTTRDGDQGHAQGPRFVRPCTDP